MLLVKRAHYRSFPEDLRPSRLAWFLAHVGGTTVEILIPVTLLLTTNNTVAMLGAIAMLAFHIFITSTFPLAVPLEWNVYFGYIAIVLWGGFGDGFDASVYNIWDFGEPLLLIPVFALLLALARRIPSGDRSVRAGRWDRREHTGFELYGKTLGILGLGKIGVRVALRASAFGMALLAYDPYLGPSHVHATESGARLARLEEVLRGSDVISVHLPLTEETRGLLGTERLAEMKRGAVVINTSRGGIIDEAALHRPIGGKPVMRAQLERLIEIADRPNITIQVLPYEVGGHAAAGGPFTILRFPEADLPDIVYLEQLTSALYLDKRPDVDRYLAVMDHLSVTAEPRDQTADILRRLLKEL